MEREPSTKHILEGRELIDYLVEKASTTTNAELLKREDRRNRRASILMALIGAVGVGGVLGGLKLFVKEEMSQVDNRMEEVAANIESYVNAKAEYFKTELSIQVDAAVHAQVEQQVGQVRTMLDQYKHYQELLAQTQLIQDELAEEKVPSKSIESAVTLLQQLAEAADIVNQPRFLEAAHVVVDLLVRMDRHSDIDTLDKLLHAVFVTHKSIALNLTDHYGQLIISSPHPVESLARESEALVRYAQASREMKYPEKALMWELFVAYKRNQYAPTRTTDVMVEMVQDLNELDTRNFCYHLFRNSHPLHWMNRPDQEGRELARLVTKLLEDYPALLAMVETEMRTPQLQPLIENMMAEKQRREARLHAAKAPPEATHEASASRSEENMLRR